MNGRELIDFIKKHRLEDASLDRDCFEIILPDKRQYKLFGNIYERDDYKFVRSITYVACDHSYATYQIYNEDDASMDDYGYGINSLENELTLEQADAIRKHWGI